jgi:hypothetical protein
VKSRIVFNSEPKVLVKCASIKACQVSRDHQEPTDGTYSASLQHQESSCSIPSKLPDYLRFPSISVAVGRFRSLQEMYRTDLAIRNVRQPSSFNSPNIRTSSHLVIIQPNQPLFSPASFSITSNNPFPNLSNCSNATSNPFPPP